MLTPLQFSQLAAAAWAGPASIVQATISTCQLFSGHLITYYTVSYTSGGAVFLSPLCSTCPFQAVAAAVAAAAAAGVPVCRHHAQRAIARTAAALCGVQLTRPGFACRARRHRCASLRHA
ncbi:hypothetical protein FY528_04850 [Hymenobacter lutimineralis]|uniref:Uncharacterized protein n=1 Tax=Hymenobacter lutimineralis TaxID=2606448 RepID=A0A5D6VBE5_9BACT|nr:hypothetical protein [Hymenobacter lutimineralis]TYZ12627.1 hypothetical protein FY528_04850 [Hymenobacter lutimineralis]